MAVPRPRKTVRRESRPARFIAASPPGFAARSKSSLQEWVAHHDAQDQRRAPVLARLQVFDNPFHGTSVVVFQTAAQSISEHLLGQVSRRTRKWRAFSTGCTVSCRAPERLASEGRARPKAHRRAGRLPSLATPRSRRSSRARTRGGRGDYGRPRSSAALGAAPSAGGSDRGGSPPCVVLPGAERVDPGGAGGGRRCSEELLQ